MYTDRPPVLPDAFGPNEVRSGSLPVEHLQLAVGPTRALRQRGIRNLDDARSFLLAPEIGSFHHAAELAEAICQLEACRGENGIDWSQYWRARGNVFHHLRASLPEFDAIGPRGRSMPVNRDNLGLVGLRLSAEGYRELGTLIDALREGIPMPPGVGKTKLEDFYGRLVALAKRLGDPLGVQDPDPKIPETAIQDALLAPAAVLPNSIGALPVDVLCPGIKCRLIRNSGYRTVCDVATAPADALAGIPSVGPGTVARMLGRISLLRSAVRGSSVDWPAYCEAAGIPLVPDRPIDPDSGPLGRLPGIFRQISQLSADPVVRDIVALRLLPPPRDQASVDEIASRHPRANGQSVSRQRIQQVESDLLRKLQGTLVRGRDLGLGFLAHPDFVSWWRETAKLFARADELTVDEFLDSLAIHWNTDIARVAEALPIVHAVITAESRLPVELRPSANLDPVLHQISGNAAGIPLRRLRLFKRTRTLEQEGVATLASLVAHARHGHCTKEDLEHLDLLATCIRKGEFNWKFYRESLALPVTPDKPVGLASTFVADFSRNIRQMLKQMTPTARSADIFWHRTRIPAEHRPTLERTGEALGTYPSTIKREETELLSELHGVLVSGQFSSLPFWIDDRWLEFLGEAREVHLASEDDFDRFGAALAVRWGLDWKQLEAALPGLWAIFTGYPTDWRGRRRARVEREIEVVSPNPIRLRGFRTVH